MYLDNAATTRVSDEIIDVMTKYSKLLYYNPGSVHPGGENVKRNIDAARHTIASCINAKREQIVFTSGGSEANALALFGLVEYLKCMNRDCIVTSSIEHPSVLETLKLLKNHGFNICELSVDKNGYIDIDELKSIINTNWVGLVSIMAVNNELGCMQDISAIGKICKENNVLFHTDCVQAAGNIDIDVEKMNIDFLSMSGHKFHAPKGTGVLYAREKGLLTPVFVGGGQEYGVRSGTENVPGIMGMAHALKNAYETSISYKDLKSAFVNKVDELCDRNDVEVVFNGDSKTNASKIVNLRFPAVDGQTLLMMLGSKGIYVSAGSACKSRSNTPSHVLKAIGLNDDEALSSIRVSFSMYNTKEDVEEAAGKIVQSVVELQSMI